MCGRSLGRVDRRFEFRDRPRRSCRKHCPRGCDGSPSKRNRDRCANSVWTASTIYPNMIFGTHRATRHLGEQAMNIERKPVAYGDLRGWIKALHAAGEIKEIDAEVDWNIEIGTVMRLAQGTGDGPAMMFNNIRDYGANARCRRVF